MIIVNTLITVVPIVLLGMIAYEVNYNNMKKSISNSVNIVFNQVNGRIEEYFDSIDALTRTLFLNPNLQTTLITEPEEYRLHYKNVQNYLNSFMELNKSIKGIWYRGYDENEYSASSYVSQEIVNYATNFDKDKLKRGKLYFSDPIIDKGVISDEFLAIRGVRSIITQKYFKEVGVGIFILNRRVLDNIIRDSNLNEKSEMFIINSHNTIIASTNSQKTGTVLSQELLSGGGIDKLVEVDNISYIVKISTVKKAEWRLVAVIPSDELLKEGNVIKASITIIVVILFILVIFINIFFNIMITRPIKKLADAFDKVASGDFKSKVRFSEKNEITKIADNFNNMVAEIKTLTRNIVNTQQRLYETEIEKKMYELNGLQSQINSHFLYNTLHCIRGMALSGAERDVVKMIENLVVFFRYAAKNGDYVSLNDEIRHLNAYFEIQNMRFGNRFRTVFCIEHDVVELKILKLILQPLAENAVFHGLEKRKGVGIVKIIARREGNYIVIKVIDNGAGMNAVKLEQLRNSLSKEQTDRENNTDKGSIGIINISKRLQIFYENNYSITIKSWENKGTAIILRLVCKREAS